MAVLANNTAASLSGVLIRLRRAQRLWADVPVRQRVLFVRRLRHIIAERAPLLAASIPRPLEESLTAEVLPLAEACRFLERNAESLLAPQRVGAGGPLWLRSVRLMIHREPFGVVLIIGPANYPLFLPGVQLAQALVAGNAVLLKPGVSGWPVASLLLECVADAGLPRDLAALLDESTESAQEAIRGGVDKVLLTGSKDTGKAVLASLAPHLTPIVAELSGWDPVFILQDADLSLAAAALRFGVMLNSGSTCIRPRVVFASRSTLLQLRDKLGVIADELELVAVDSETQALRKASESEYALGATVFGSVKKASALAARIRAGVVVINDMIVPTAHPSVPFGGRGSSGFGVTRGAEGLLELTTLKTIAIQRARWLPHLDSMKPNDARLFTAFIRVLHEGTLGRRLRACSELWGALRERRKEI